MSSKISKAGLFLPHIYFTIISIVIATNPNFTMIGIAILMLAMIFLKNKILNLSASAFLLFFSFWMMLAYISDFNKIAVLDYKTWQFIIIGGLFVLTNFIMSLMMGFPYFKEQVDMCSDDNFIYIR